MITITLVDGREYGYDSHHWTMTIEGYGVHLVSRGGAERHIRVPWSAIGSVEASS